MTHPKKLSFRQMAAIGIFTGLGSVAGTAGFNYFTDGQITEPSAVQKALTQIASQTNQSLPMMLDRHTRLDTTLAAGGNRFIYMYTLVDIDPGALNPELFAAEIKPNLINSYQTHADMEAFRAMNVALTYSYRSEEGIELLQVTISPDDFSNKIL